MARRAQWRSFAHAKCDVDDALATTFALAKSVEVAVPRGRRDDEDAIARALDDDANAIVGTHFEAEMSIADALDPHFVHEHVRRWTAAKTKTKTRDAGATFGLTTIDAEVDSDDCFCVTPKGRFVASLMADAKESLGMQTTEDARGKALASVNLTREEFKVGNWFHDRIGACARAFEQRTGKVKGIVRVHGEWCARGGQVSTHSDGGEARRERQDFVASSRQFGESKCRVTRVCESTDERGGKGHRC